MRGIEAADDVEHGRGGVGRRQRPFGRHAIFQRPAGQELHRDDRYAVDLFAAEDVDRVRMTDGCGQLPFAQEPRTVLGALQPAAQDLERQPSSRRQLFRFEHLAHAAAARADGRCDSFPRCHRREAGRTSRPQGSPGEPSTASAARNQRRRCSGGRPDTAHRRRQGATPSHNAHKRWFDTWRRRPYRVETESR